MRIELLRTEDGTEAALFEMIDRVDLLRDGLRLSLRLLMPASDGDRADIPTHLALTRFVPVGMKRRAVEMRLVLECDSTPARVDLPLLKAVARGRPWSQDLLSGGIHSVRELPRREQIAPRYGRELLPLGFRSPKTVDAIAEGCQAAELTVIKLIRRINLPLRWNAQEQAIGLR